MKKRINFKDDILLGNKSYFILAILIIILTCLSPIFLTQANLLNVIRQVCVTTIACAGYTLLLGSGHMDLSVGMILMLTGVVVAQLICNEVAIPIAIAIGLLLGAVCGMFNGVLITVFSLPPFIVTLGSQYIFKGLGYVLTGNVPVSNLPSEFVEIGQGYVGIIPIPVFIMIGTIIIISFLLSFTSYGRHALAMGGNAEAARACGININRVRIVSYGVLGACAALASVVQTARSASAQLSAGQDLSMDVIAAAVIGGTSMKGGNANVWGSLIGCLVVGIVSNGLNLLRVDANWQIVAKGVIILFAVILDATTTRAYEKISIRNKVEQQHKEEKNGN